MSCHFYFLPRPRNVLHDKCLPISCSKQLLGTDTNKHSSFFFRGRPVCKVSNSCMLHIKGAHDCASVVHTYCDHFLHCFEIFFILLQVFHAGVLKSYIVYTVYRANLHALY
ncbi:unnamed protein product [Ixodes pacificus]